MNRTNDDKARYADHLRRMNKIVDKYAKPRRNATDVRVRTGLDEAFVAEINAELDRYGSIHV